MTVSTGLIGLDKVIQPVMKGDNVIWRVDSIDDYIPFVEHFCNSVLSRGEKLVYFRFGNHKPIVEEKPGIIVRKAHPEAGFENFITEIHKHIKNEERGGYYVFDSLSSLSDECYSDRMIGNFFKLTCNYLGTLGATAYFSMKRNFHSYHATDNIYDTTQLLVDVYRHRSVLYIQPTIMKKGNQANTFMLWEWAEDDFLPVKESSLISDVKASSPFPGLPSASYRMIGVWDKTFMRAEAVLERVKKKQSSPEEEKAVLQKILRLFLSRDRRIFELAMKYLTLEDVLYIWKRMIGTGMIGGKSTGMLLARAILNKKSDRWVNILEKDDSFFIGSDVFYTFLVINDCWWDRQRQKDPEKFLDGNEDVRRRILEGRFPEYIVTRFGDLLDYYGESPIIVRSSSLLEDNFGNAFAGKYESVFLANQGSREERLERFMNAVRLIYASTMSEKALRYRKVRGVLDKDEQMALLVQRVSGAPHGIYFYPQLSGVAFSYNHYAWNREIDPEAGMLRLVFGLGTRAVDRSDDDLYSCGSP